MRYRRAALALGLFASTGSIVAACSTSSRPGEIGEDRPDTGLCVANCNGSFDGSVVADASDASRDTSTTDGGGGISCTNNKQDGDETDVDCGGSCTVKCPTLEHCKVDGDCISSYCVLDDAGTLGTCKKPLCTDGVRNGDETDVDCGGSCKPCGVGDHCLVGKDCAGGNCAANQTCDCPAGMTIAPGPIVSGTAYCIDTLEVTKAQYNAFWKANPNNQPSVCSWNSDYAPLTEWPPNLSPGATYTGGDPVRDIDWCDAYAYCNWVGKRLCGKIGGGPSDPDPAKANDPAFDQWYNACSATGPNIWPYGRTFDPNRCNITPKAPHTGDTESFVYLQDQPDTSMLACQGGTTGLYNMSGDVAEWVDACNGATGANDNCLVRGGSYNANGDSTQLRCDAIASAARNTVDPSIGFRCCL